MSDYEKILSIKEKIDKLAQGIDPSSNMYFPEDTVLCSSSNKDTFKQVSLILDRVLRVGGKIEKIDKRVKYPFHIGIEQIASIKLSKEPIPISTFVYAINEVISNSEMKKLRATQVTNWLMKNGYLTEIEQGDGKVFKILTEKSSSIGMSSTTKTNAYGRIYDTNMYDERAQKYILSHINEIAQ